MDQGHRRTSSRWASVHGKPVAGKNNIASGQPRLHSPLNGGSLSESTHEFPFHSSSLKMFPQASRSMAVSVMTQVTKVNMGLFEYVHWTSWPCFQDYSDLEKLYTIPREYIENEIRASETWEPVSYKPHRANCQKILIE